MASHFLTIFAKINNFSDFLFASLHYVAPNVNPCSISAVKHTQKLIKSQRLHYRASGIVNFFFETW